MNDYTFQQDSTTGRYYGTRHSDRDPLKTIDIVFISEGYTVDEMGAYQDAVGDIERRLFATEPFNRYEKFFNVKWINLVSLSGPRGALDAQLYGGVASQNAVWMVDFAGVTEVLKDVGLNGPGMADVVVVGGNAETGNGRAFSVHPNILEAMGLVGDELEDVCRRYGLSIPTKVRDDGVTVADFGATIGISITQGKGEGYEDTAVHEFGHALAGLFDEYYHVLGPDFLRPIQPDKSHLVPNLVVLSREELDLSASPPPSYEDLEQGVRDKIKWDAWVLPNTPVPTLPWVPYPPFPLPPSNYASGLFVGGGFDYPSASTAPSATYRSHRVCKMGFDADGAPALDEPFCTVCREALIGAIYEHPGLHLISRTEPSAGSPVDFTANHAELPLLVEANVDFDGGMISDWTFSPPEQSFPSTTAQLVILTRKDSGEISIGNGDGYGMATYSFMSDWPDLTVTVTIKDTTPWVKRQDIKDLMQGAATWQVKLGPVLADSPWPTFQHDVQRTGRARNAGPLNPFVEWTAPDLVSPSSSAVIGEDGTIYVAGKDSDLLAFERESGTTKWRFSHPSQRRMATPLAAVNPYAPVDPHTVRNVIRVGSEDGGIYSLDASNGGQVWGIDDVVDRSSLGIVYVPGALNIGKSGTSYWGAMRTDSDGITNRGYLAALDNTSENRWDGPALCGHGFDAATSAVSDEGIIYIAYRDVATFKRYLVAFNPDGTWAWKAPYEIGTLGEPDVGTTGAVWGPVVGDSGTIYVAMGKRLCAVGPDGREQWRCSLNQDISAFPVIGDNGTVYVAAGNDISALRASDGRSVWHGSVHTDGTVSCLALDGNGTLYAASWDHFLYGIIGATTRMQWRLPSDRAPTAMAIGEETIYVVLGDQLHAVTEALFVEGFDCDIRVIDKFGRWVSPPGSLQWVGNLLPGATYGPLGGHTGVRAVIPHPIKNSVYQVEVSPLGGGPVDPNQPYELWVVEGLNRYPLAKGAFGDLPAEPYTFQYPTPTLTAITIHTEDLPVINGQAILISGGGGTFTAIGIDVLGQKHVISPRWRLSRSIGELQTVRKNRARVRASARAGVRGVLSITFRKMTARLPVRIVSGRPQRARRTLKRS